MPTQVDLYSLERARAGIMRALKKINRAAGYNNTPTVAMGAVLLDKIPDGGLPALRVEMADLTLSQEFVGGGSQGLVYYDWPAMIWGYVKTSQGKEDLYRRGAGLLADVQAAVFQDETLQDGDGQGSVLLANPDQITFDMESFSTINKGYFVAEFRLVVAINRGVNP